MPITSHKEAPDNRDMFDDIANDYDKLNHILSLGIDKQWRKKLVRMLIPLENKTVLDIATGTGDLAFAMIRHKPQHIHGIDFSSKMIGLCRKKIEQKKAGQIFSCEHADVMNMPFQEDMFDIASIAFGIRNFGNTEASLTEIHRVLKPGGKLVVLEFFRSRLVKKNRFYRFYMKSIMPKIGKLLSGHPWAYTYLFKSTENFLSETEFADLMINNGFERIRIRKLMFGMAFIIEGTAGKK